MGKTVKACVRDATLGTTGYSNHWLKPIKFYVEWMGVLDWFLACSYMQPVARKVAPIARKAARKLTPVAHKVASCTEAFKEIDNQMQENKYVGWFGKFKERFRIAPP